MQYQQEIENYVPVCDQEQQDKAVVLTMLRAFPETILQRENAIVHMTSSAFIVNENLDKALFVYHNIYDSWSWTGGHSDGEGDLLQTACREAREETGLLQVEPLLAGMASLDILPVLAHRKNGCHISTHLHIAPGYLLQARESAPLRHRKEENSAVRWLPLSQLAAFCTEKHMLPVYEKLCRRIDALRKA